MYSHRRKNSISTTEFHQNWTSVKQAILNCIHSGILDSGKASALEEWLTDKLAVVRCQKIYGNNYINAKKIHVIIG